jgi:hypothetical protein
MRCCGAGFPPGKDRLGSFSTETPHAASPSMSAVPPIATEFCAPQGMAVSAKCSKNECDFGQAGDEKKVGRLHLAKIGVKLTENNGRAGDLSSFQLTASPITTATDRARAQRQ